MADENKKVMPALPTMEGWEEDQVGFPPYWKPTEVGHWFSGKIMMLDERDPDFPRWVIEATQHEVMCSRGPSVDNNDILVIPGELYTVNNYSGLPLDRYIGWEILAWTDKKRKLAASTKPDAEDYQKRVRDLWDWRVRIPPELKQLLKSQREEDAKRMFEARQQARQQALQTMAANPDKLFR